MPGKGIYRLSRTDTGAFLKKMMARVREREKAVCRTLIRFNKYFGRWNGIEQQPIYGVAG